MTTPTRADVLAPCPICSGVCQFHTEPDEPEHQCHYIECLGCKTVFDCASDDNPESLDELRVMCAERFNRRTLTSEASIIADAARYRFLVQHDEFHTDSFGKVCVSIHAGDDYSKRKYDESIDAAIRKLGEGQ